MRIEERERERRIGKEFRSWEKGKYCVGYNVYGMGVFLFLLSIFFFRARLVEVGCLVFFLFLFGGFFFCVF